jgi:diguanylate cyclase (GGDEF)-like protein
MTQPHFDMPYLLEKLGKMTAIRDTQLLEQSLLRSLGLLLGVHSSSLYHVDETQVVMRALHHSCSVEIDGSGVEHTVDYMAEVHDDIHISDALHALFDNVRTAGRVCNRIVGDRLLTAYPLLDGNTLHGYFVCEHKPRQVTDAVVLGILEIFSNYYSLLDTSQRDRLTGLLNRYSLEQNLDRLWSVLEARRHEHIGNSDRRDSLVPGYWVVLLDIDHFKKINDTFGHIMGDEVLILVTRLMKSALRRSDLLYRYGGEEFVAMITAGDLDAATLVFERVRKTIAEHRFPQVGPVTISGGFAGADPTVLPQAVLNRADRALYQAKSGGRNRIHHFDTLVEAGVLSELGVGAIDLF